MSELVPDEMYGRKINEAERVVLQRRMEEVRKKEAEQKEKARQEHEAREAQQQALKRAQEEATRPRVATLSDRRAKTDIAKVGTTYEGLTVYRFRYKGGGSPLLGVMAQDVEKVKPAAVREFGGVKHVNLSQLASFADAA